LTNYGQQVPISDTQLIKVLEDEARYRCESGPKPAKPDKDFISDAEAAVAELKARPGDKKARLNARKVANRIQSKPLRGRKLD
jgi:hypothetical protein